MKKIVTLVLVLFIGFALVAAGIASPAGYWHPSETTNRLGSLAIISTSHL